MGLSVHDPFVDALGNPLGIAKVPEFMLNPRTIYIQGSRTVSTSDVFEVPGGTQYMRITVIGGGGGGGNANAGKGGGGGGLARSPVSKVSRGEKVSYAIAPGGSQLTAGGSTSVSFKNISMLATGGAGAVNGINSVGGVGSGGEVNTSGGLGVFGGGGCGGINSNGGDSGPAGANSLYSGDGGGGGAGNGGGGGFGQPGGDNFNTVNSASYQARDSRVGPTKGFSYPIFNNGGSDGGNFGGGGGTGGSLLQADTCRGGLGGLIIELW